MPRTGQRSRFACSKCGEPTTHVYKKNDAGTLEWVCLCCESEKSRTPEELAKIKATRKGWKSEHWPE